MNVRELTNWIDVAERKPDVGADVLLRTRANNLLHGWLTVDDDYWIPELNTWLGGDGRLVVHWMPLTVPPLATEQEEKR